jgi:hypothetical protein
MANASLAGSTTSLRLVFDQTETERSVTTITVRTGVASKRGRIGQPILQQSRPVVDCELHVEPHRGRYERRVRAPSLEAACRTQKAGDDERVLSRAKPSIVIAEGRDVIRREHRYAIDKFEMGTDAERWARTDARIRDRYFIAGGHNASSSGKVGASMACRFTEVSRPVVVSHLRSVLRAASAARRTPHRAPTRNVSAAVQRKCGNRGPDSKFSGECRGMPFEQRCVLRSDTTGSSVSACRTRQRASAHRPFLMRNSLKSLQLTAHWG